MNNIVKQISNLVFNQRKIDFNVSKNRDDLGTFDYDRCYKVKFFS